MIRKANHKDAKAIIKIIESVHIKKVKNMDNGFLMSEDLSEVSYGNMLKECDHCYVYELDNEVVGFIIALSNRLMEKTNEINSYFIDNYANEEFVYIYQVAVSQDFQRKGIAKNLYQHLFNLAKIKNFKVITSKEPLNKASRLFHKELGFKDIDIFNWSDGVESYAYEFKK